MHADRIPVADALYGEALELVHQHRAASVALLARHLGIGLDLAEALLQRMARETTTVRRVPSGLYLYTHGPIGEELAALHGFAQEVLAAIAGDSVDVAQLRAAAGRYGLAIPHQAALRRLQPEPGIADRSPRSVGPTRRSGFRWPHPLQMKKKPLSSSSGSAAESITDSRHSVHVHIAVPRLDNARRAIR